MNEEDKHCPDKNNYITIDEYQDKLNEWQNIVIREFFNDYLV